MTAPRYQLSWDSIRWDDINEEGLCHAALLYFEDPEDVLALLKKGIKMRLGGIHYRVAPDEKNEEAA